MTIFRNRRFTWSARLKKQSRRQKRARNRRKVKRILYGRPNPTRSCYSGTACAGRVGGHGYCTGAGGGTGHSSRPHTANLATTNRCIDLRAGRQEQPVARDRRV